MKKRIFSVATVVLALIMICGIAQRDNDRRELMERYLNKIWIADDHTGEYYDEYSFCFLEIGGGKCQGGLEPDRVCHIEDCFRIEEGELVWNTENVFSGTIRGNTAECQFTDRWGRTGNVKMTFINENEIEMTLEYHDREDISRTSIYRPYNISDMQHFTLQAEQPIHAALAPGGKAYITAGVHHWDNAIAFLRSEPSSEAYLMNEDREVLDILQFDTSVHVETKIDDILIGDVNEDGLEDVTISVCFVDHDTVMEGMPHMHWLFLQSDMGMFESYSLKIAEDDPILGGYPDAKEDTWEREFQNCVRAMELKINENRHLLVDREQKRDTVLWYDTLNRFYRFIEECAGCQTKIMGDGEEVYRTAVLLIAEMRDRNGRSDEPYEFLSSHGEDIEMAREEFGAVVKRENPIDEAIAMFHEKFDEVYYASYDINVLQGEAWEKEFYHCLELVRASVREEDAEKEDALAEMLEAYKAFFALWADHVQMEEENEGGSGMRGGIGWRRAEVFRIGAMLLIDGYEKAGGSYEFLYDSEADLQMLTEWYADFLNATR